MNNIVNWEYYSSLYNKVDEEDFDEYEAKAEREVRAVIGAVRWANITPDDFGFDVLQDCLCQVIDQIAEDSAADYGKGLTSVSNDGYSESFAYTSPEEVRASLHGKIKVLLSGTGMVGAY